MHGKEKSSGLGSLGLTAQKSPRRLSPKWSTCLPFNRDSKTRHLVFVIILQKREGGSGPKRRVKWLAYIKDTYDDVTCV